MFLNKKTRQDRLPSLKSYRNEVWVEYQNTTAWLDSNMISTNFPKSQHNSHEISVSIFTCQYCQCLITILAGTRRPFWRGHNAQEPLLLTNLFCRFHTWIIGITARYDRDVKLHLHREALDWRIAIDLRLYFVRVGECYWVVEWSRVGVVEAVRGEGSKESYL